MSVFLLGTSQQVNAADSTNAHKMAPIIMYLLDDGSVTLEIGNTNSDVLSSADYPNGALSTFPGVVDGLILSFQIDDLKPNQILNIIVNGRVVAQITSNGFYNIELSSSLLSTSQNTLEFVASPVNATWTVSKITLLNDEGPFSRAEAVRFLTKATFGADEASINRLLQLGYEAWVDEQLTVIPTLHLPFYLQDVEEHTAAGITVGATLSCGMKTDAWLNGALDGADQLRQRMAFALSQIFVVGDFACDHQEHSAFTYFYDILISGGLDNYRELLEDVTLTPIMGEWLSLKGSQVQSDVHGTSPDENFAREVMQLFSIGVFELNLDGSLKLQNGLPIDTYNNEIVHDVARALTGWQWDGGRFYFGVRLLPMTPWNNEYARFHDHEEKTILNGVVIPAGFRDILAHLKPESEWLHSGNSIVDDLKIVLDTIAEHDNVAPFLSKQLIQRFVTSNPSPQYIARIAGVFNDNGSGVKGDLGAVIKAILLDSESINSHENTTTGGKLKEPLIRATQLWRAFEAESPIKYTRYLQMSRDFGQRPMGADSVFNFYRPDYAPLGAITDQGLVAPEFYLMDDSQLLTTYPAMQDLLESRTISDGEIVAGNYSNAQQIRPVLNLTSAKSVADNTSALMNYFNQLLFGGLMSNELRDRVIQYIDDEVVYDDDFTDDERREKKVEEALFLLGVSPEFNVQR